MKLDKYVEETIKQVISGIGAAKDYGDQNNARVNPASASFTSGNTSTIYSPTQVFQYKKYNLI